MQPSDEFWMMSEAKKRNPDVVTYGLPWGGRAIALNCLHRRIPDADNTTLFAAPGWINNQSGYYHGPDMITYLVNWLRCARDYHGVSRTSDCHRYGLSSLVDNWP